MLINLTPEEHRILTNPTRIEQLGKQQRIASNVKGQIMALTSEWVRLNEYDIIAINKAVEANRIGHGIATAAWRSGGWALNEWEQSTFSLRSAVNRSDWTDPDFSAPGVMEH